MTGLNLGWSLGSSSMSITLDPQTICFRPYITHSSSNRWCLVSLTSWSRTKSNSYCDLLKMSDSNCSWLNCVDDKARPVQRYPKILSAVHWTGSRHKHQSTNTEGFADHLRFSYAVDE
jgi:hypothetical protein